MECNRHFSYSVFLIVFILYFFKILFCGYVFSNTYSLQQIFPFSNNQTYQTKNNLTDPLRHWISLTYAVAEKVKTGIFPVWEIDHIDSGYFIAGDGFTCAINPIVFLLWVIHPYRFCSLVAIFSILICTIAIYEYLKLIRLRNYACFVGGLSVLLSPTLLIYAEYYTMLFTMAGMCVSLYFIEELAKFQWRNSLFFAIVVFSFFSIGGSVHGVIFGFIFLVSYMIFRKINLKYICLFISGFLMLYAIQLIPIVYAYIDSQKIGNSCYGISIPIIPSHFISWIYPKLLHMIRIDNIFPIHIPYYSGITITILLIFAICTWKYTRKLQKFFLLFTVINIVFIDYLGNTISSILSFLPVRQLFDSKFMLFNTISIIIVASFSIDTILKYINETKHIFDRIVNIVFKYIVLPITCILIVVTIFFYTQQGFIKEKCYSLVEKLLQAQEYKYSQKSYLIKVNNFLNEIKSVVLCTSKYNVFPFVIVFLLWWYVRRCKNNHNDFIFYFFIIFLVECWWGGKIYQVDMMHKSKVFPKLEFVQWLKKRDSTDYKVLILQNSKDTVLNRGEHFLLLSNTFIPYGLKSLGGFEAMHNRFYYEDMNMMMNGKKGKCSYLEFYNFDYNVIGYWGVKYIITPIENRNRKLHDKRLRLIFKKYGVRIYER